MSATRDLPLPLSEAVVITAGLPTHLRMLEYIRAAKPLPIDLGGQVLLHFGGYNQELAGGGAEIIYMNPTTSTRFNPLMPEIIRSQRLRAVGGKGGLNAACAAAMKEVGCVYLSFPGGAATLYKQALREVSQVEWRDFILHYRLMKLRVERLGPGTVGIDAHGNSLYDGLQAQAEARLPEIMQQLKAARAASDTASAAAGALNDVVRPGNSGRA
jgi:fumarate hydratase subunit beta